jgi:site-specific DNA recombinase
MTVRDKNYEINQLIEAIERGDFRDMYLIYNRKSLDEAESQKNSIKYQKHHNLRFAEEMELPIANLTIEGFCRDGVISEKHSGFKEKNDIEISEGGIVQYSIQRPKFSRLVYNLNQGNFKGVICLCWDRISRNKADNTVVRKLMKQGVDIHFVTAKYDKSSAGELHMDVDGMFSEHHSRVTSEKVGFTNKLTRDEGYVTYRAPIGYLNEGSMYHKEIDPVRGPIIQELFEMYATGEWSLISLAKWANEHGLTTVPMRKRRTQEELLADDEDEEEVREQYSRPVTENHMSRILRNPFYVGLITNSKGNYIRSRSHEPLVSEELFDQVQELLDQKRISKRYVQKLDHPFRGIVRCAQCKRVFSPYPKKGIMYYGARCQKGCANTLKSLNQDQVADMARTVINNLNFTTEELELFEARANTEIALLDIKRSKDLDKIEARKKRIREELAYLEQDRVSLLRHKVYTPEEYAKEVQKLRKDLEMERKKESASDEAMAALVDDTVKLSELIKNVVPIYDFANPHEKEAITRILVSELYVDENTLDFSPMNHLKGFVNREYAIGDPTGNRT